MKVSGRLGDPATTQNDVKQGCPLSPTLFGVFIDALDFWKQQQALAAGVLIR